MCVHVFGLTSSPFVATYVLRQAAFDNAVGVSDTAIVTALDALYVDDPLTSACTEEELIVFFDELNRLLYSRGFYLTKCFSNSKQVLATVPRDRLAHRIGLSSSAICPLAKHLGSRIMQLQMTLL